MKIFLEITNSKTGFNEHGYYDFEILSCCSPHDLWIVVDHGINDENGINTHDFEYRKIVSLMEVTTLIDGKKFHGQVATIALGSYGHLYNIILNLGEEYPNYEWRQIENFINGNNEFYVLEFDELRQSKEYADLSLEECIKQLLLTDQIGYEIHTLRSIDKDGNILNILEREKLL